MIYFLFVFSSSLSLIIYASIFSIQTTFDKSFLSLKIRSVFANKFSSQQQRSFIYFSALFFLIITTKLVMNCSRTNYEAINGSCFYANYLVDSFGVSAGSSWPNCCKYNNNKNEKISRLKVLWNQFLCITGGQIYTECYSFLALDSCDS